MSWFGNALVWMGFRAKYGLILEDRLDTDIATRLWLAKKQEQGGDPVPSWGRGPSSV